MQAMIYRVHQLKAITDNQYQYMMRQVSKKGWRTNEPGDMPYYFNENIFQGFTALKFLLADQVEALAPRVKENVPKFMCHIKENSALWFFSVNVVMFLVIWYYLNDPTQSEQIVVSCLD